MHKRETVLGTQQTALIKSTHTPPQAKKQSLGSVAKGKRLELKGGGGRGELKEQGPLLSEEGDRKSVLRAGDSPSPPPSTGPHVSIFPKTRLSTSGMGGGHNSRFQFAWACWLTGTGLTIMNNNRGRG